jgi:hypothetical protein
MDEDHVDRWRLGWALGGGVVVVAAALLLVIIGYARRIAGQADDIAEAIRGARDHTAPLFDLTEVNGSLERIARQLDGDRGAP